MTRNDKLHRLLLFYDDHYDKPEQACQHCPFHGETFMKNCSELCFTFPKLQTESESCPCHEWGAILAMQKLENLLIEEKMIEG